MNTNQLTQKEKLMVYGALAGEIAGFVSHMKVWESGAMEGRKSTQEIEAAIQFYNERIAEYRQLLERFNK